MIITLAGYPVAGKGTVAAILTKELGYQYWGAGQVWRKEAAKLGLSLSEFHERLKTHPEYDKLLDAEQAALGNEDNIIVDGKLGFHFVPNSLKVYLTVDHTEAAKRLIAAKRPEEPGKSLKDAKAWLEERVQSERDRFIPLYGVDNHDLKHFDLIIDTTHRSPQEVATVIAAVVRDGHSHSASAPR